MARLGKLNPQYGLKFKIIKLFPYFKLSQQIEWFLFKMGFIFM